MAQVYISATLPKSANNALKRAGVDFEAYRGKGLITEAELQAHLSDAKVLITALSTPVSAATLAKAPHLKLIANYGAGFNNIDITAASLGRLLKARGYKVMMQKADPYLNVDPGTMSPFQHGEVFVTEDGKETDLDLGHYERFIDENLTRESNFTTGLIYQSLIQRERAGDFLGGTVQVIPHVTDAIKARFARIEEVTNADVVITELGGTIGDIESQPFVEAIRQFRKERGVSNVAIIHVSLVPYIAAAHEVKTKPTQHSVKELRSSLRKSE